MLLGGKPKLTSELYVNRFFIERLLLKIGEVVMKIKIILIVTILSFSFVSFAGTGSGKVIQIMPHQGDAVIFITESRAGSVPECAVPSGGQWALSLSTEDGKAMYAMLLAAFLTGKDVHVQGSSACYTPNMNIRENPVYIWMDS